MVLIATLFAIAIVVGLGRVLVGTLGWPTNMERAGRWGIALLVAAIAFSLVPGFLARASSALGPLPQVPVDNLVSVLVGIGVTVLGYVAWTKGAEQRERERKDEDQTRLLERRRATPPAPAEDERPRTFAPVRRGPDDPNPQQ